MFWRTWNLGTEILETWKLELDVQVGSTAGFIGEDMGIWNDQTRSRDSPERIAQVASSKVIVIQSHSKFLPVIITLFMCTEGDPQNVLNFGPHRIRFLSDFMLHIGALSALAPRGSDLTAEN